ncbi:MAG: Hsp20/alpha crystallin family protein [Planctomycetota bacterium]
MYTHALSWDPFRDVEQWFAEADRAFARARTTSGVGPGINAVATDDTVVLTMQLPGVAQNDLEIGLHEAVMTIAAKRHIPATPLSHTLVREREDFAFRRSVQLPFQVAEDHVEARLKDGVLTITLKRAEADKPRRIAISAA